MNDKMRTVLFVYVRNSGRSQMAEAFFNKLAEGSARAFSAGTQPADKINPVIVEAMQEVGIDINGNKPKALTMEMVENTDKMITMGCSAEAKAVCPAGFVETEDWALEDPKGESREEENRINKLLKEIL